MPERTREAFAGGFHAGDVGYLDDAGYLYVFARIKAINTGGVLIASREIEDALYPHSAVSERL